MVDFLKKIGQYIAMHKTDYDFAKFMIEMPITERLGWISDNFIWYTWKRRKYNSRRLWELGGFAGYVIYIKLYGEYGNSFLWIEAAFNYSQKHTLTNSYDILNIFLPIMSSPKLMILQTFL